MSSLVTSAEPSEPPLFTRDFALILATQLAFGFAFSSFFLLPKYVVTQLAGSPSQVGYVGALSVVAAVLSSPSAGKLLDRGGRLPLMFAGCLLSALAAFAFLGVTHIGAYLYAVRAVQGVAYTLYFVAVITLVADLAPASRLGQAIGWVGCAGLVMNAVATMVAERIAERFGWHAVFGAAAASGLCGAVLTLLLREPPAQPKPVTLEPRPAPTSARLAVMWATVAGGMGFGAMFTFTAPLALSLGDSNISPLFAGYTTAALAVRLLFGTLGDRLGRARVGGAALALYSLVVASTAGLGHGWLGALGLAFGLAHGAFYPSVNALALEGVGREQRGTVGAYFNAAFNAGVLIVTFCFGQVAQQYGYRIVFLLVAGLSVSGSLALFSRSRKSLLVRPS
ncbi:MAG: MFS transporter [Myxococcales bacterium]